MQNKNILFLIAQILIATLFIATGCNKKQIPSIEGTAYTTASVYAEDYTIPAKIGNSQPADDVIRPVGRNFPVRPSIVFQSGVSENLKKIQCIVYVETYTAPTSNVLRDTIQEIIRPDFSRIDIKIPANYPSGKYKLTILLDGQLLQFQKEFYSIISI
jgi:hypothetical protein